MHTCSGVRHLGKEVDAKLQEVCHWHILRSLLTKEEVCVPAEVHEQHPRCGAAAAQDVGHRLQCVRLHVTSSHMSYE